MKQQQPSHVGIELTGNVSRIRNELVVVAHQRADYFTDFCFSGALLATEAKRGSHLDAELLKDLGEPADDPL